MSKDGWIEDPELEGLYITDSGIGYDFIEGVHFRREGVRVHLVRLPSPSDYITPDADAP